MADLPTLIDEALGRYYALHGHDSYFNDANEGKFKLFCDENDFGNPELIDELGQEPGDSMLTDFDEDMPMQDEFEDDDEARSAAIFKIIQNCANDPNAYKEIYALEVTANDFDNIDQEFIDKIAALNKKQAPSIFKEKESSGKKGALQDNIFLKLVALSHEKKQPYFQFLADMFQRARVDNIGNSDYTLEEWANDNAHIKEIQNSSKGKKDIVSGLVAAVRSYNHRVCPALMLRPTNVIVDSLANTCVQIAYCVEFVAILAAAKKQTCPFQFDAVFGFNETREVKDESANNDDTDEDDEVDETNQGDANGGVFYDIFGDVKKKLAAEKLLHCAFPINDKKGDDEKEDVGNELPTNRMFKDAFKVFRQETIKNKYKDQELAQYPREHRFNAFVDRRQPDDKDNKGKGILEKDELIFYEPPNNANKLPHEGRSPMVYFDRSRTVLIPSIGYEEGRHDDDDVKVDDDKKDVDHKKKLLESVVTSQSKMNGAMLTLSFHVESTDEIRCYLYMNGQCIRFMPRDIIDLLPVFFDNELGDNASWKTSEEAKGLVEEMDKKLVDIYFDAFIGKYQPSSTTANREKKEKEEKDRIKNKYVIDQIV